MARSSTGSDPYEELRDGAGAVVGDGEAPDGRWRIRGLTRNGRLYVALEYWLEPPGRWVERGGVGGVEVTDTKLPVRLSGSGPGLRSWHQYFGQAIEEVTRIELQLADGSVTRASLLRHEALPVQMWIAFIDGSAGPTVLRAFAGEALLDSFEIEDEWPLPPGNKLWGPVD